jgi:hypothetical protein
MPKVVEAGYAAFTEVEPSLSAFSLEPLSNALVHGGRHMGEVLDVADDGGRQVVNDETVAVDVGREAEEVGVSGELLSRLMERANTHAGPAARPSGVAGRAVATSALLSRVMGGRAWRRRMGVVGARSIIGTGGIPDGMLAVFRCGLRSAVLS